MLRCHTLSAMVSLTCLVFLLFLVACGTTRAGVSTAEEGVYAGEAPGRGGPPPHAPAHGYRAKYTYRYYPDTHVYYDTSRRLYFYLAADEWRVSASLPAEIRVQLGDYVVITSDSDRPYLHSEKHPGKYPPGQMKKGK